MTQLVNRKEAIERRQAVVERLNQLAEQNNGALLPKLVVEDARAPDSVLHHSFEWHDDVAGEKFRLLQAAYLIRTVRVTIETTERKPVTIRAFFSEKNGTGYQRTETALGSDELREKLLTAARQELMAFRRKYADLEEIGGVLTAIDALA